jgi:menaquinone-9 beta-reductase
VRLIDKATFPRDKCCGDGLTTGALRHLEELGLDPRTVASWQHVDNVHVVSTHGYGVTFPLPRNSGSFAVIARRVDLDHAVLDLARTAGVDVREGIAARTVSQDPDAVTVLGSDGIRYVADFLVAADGMWSHIRKSLGSHPANDINLNNKDNNKGKGDKVAEPYLGEWHGYRQYFSNVTTPESRDLWVWFEPDLAGGYVWSFPLAGNTVNVGFGVERRKGRPTRVMKQQWADMLARPHIRNVLGHSATGMDAPKAWPIPAAINKAQLSNGRVLFVGDAAKACDVLTGEGIGQALQTGVAAGTTIGAFAAQGPVAVRERYELDTRSALGPDHRMAWTLQRMMRNSLVCRGALRIAGTSDWTRRNFARWLFEDYARGIALTPRRWHRGAMSGPGAYVGANVGANVGVNVGANAEVTG